MKLTFLGTRGNIEERTDGHARHSSLEVASEGRRVMVDCGEDWLEEVHERAPDAIVLTHAHPDHAFGLRNGSPSPVWAPAATWDNLPRFPVEDRRELEPRAPTRVEGITFEAFPVEHSTVAPAVGYRISVGERTVFYAPDVVYIPERAAALGGARLYVGDGATLRRSMVRRRGERLIGHAPVRTQLTWCAKEGVPRAVVTHCGSGIVKGDPEDIDADLREMARERGVEAAIAWDGMEVTLD